MKPFPRYHILIELKCTFTLIHTANLVFFQIDSQNDDIIEQEITFVNYPQQPTTVSSNTEGRHQSAENFPILKLRTPCDNSCNVHDKAIVEYPIDGKFHVLIIFFLFHFHHSM